VIRVPFVEPNFEAEIVDRHGREFTELHHADSEAELRTRLNKRVTGRLIASVGKITPYQFADWKAKADKEAATCNAAKKAGIKYEFRDTIWGALKEHLITLFRSKCAYCETRCRVDSWGEVEHYRPKGKVTDENQVEIKLANGDPHPGYYWQAYDHLNYVLACSICNGSLGKLNQFPIAGTRACCPEDDLSKEDPLLLNPLVDDPKAWLTFIPRVGTTDVGTVTGAKPRGLATLDIVSLNREDLLKQRSEAQRAARLELKNAMAQDDGVNRVETLIQEFSSGEPPYSAAALAEIRRFLKQWQEISIDV
jgi:hypothetical protein